MEELKAEARRRGLWNLFLPHETEWTAACPTSTTPLWPRSSGGSPLAPEACNCSAPDTGNMEILHLFGSDRAKERWLAAAARRRDPLGVRHDRAGRGLLATPPTSRAASSATATTTSSTAASGGSPGARRHRCAVLIVMGKTDPSSAAPPASSR